MVHSMKLYILFNKKSVNKLKTENIDRNYVRNGWKPDNGIIV